MKSNTNYTKKPKQIRISEYPELKEMIVDLSIFMQKYTVPTIANSIGLSKQAIQQHINKKLEASK